LHNATTLGDEAERLMSQALYLHRQGKLAQAEPLCRQVLAASPSHAEARHMLDVVALRQRRLEDADRLMVEALAVSPDSAETLNNRGTTLRALGRRDEALAAYDKALAIRPGFAEALHNRGNVLRDLGRREDALVSYDAAVAARPGYLGAHFNRGNLLRDLGRLEEALACYDAALAIRTDSASTLHNRGDVLLKLRRSEEALASYDKALATRANHVEALNNRAGALLQLKRPEEALTSCDRALAIRPDYPEALSNRAKALLQLGRQDEAIAAYQKTLSIRPNYVETYRQLAAALQGMGRFDEAAAHFERALALKPDDVAMHCAFADALQKHGRRSGAVARYEQALALDADNVAAHLGLAGALEQDKPAEATVHYERALALKPDLANVRFRACTAQLPILYRDTGEIEERRAAYWRQLDRLCDDVEQRRVGNLAGAVGTSQPFYLPYQGRNDRDLQSKYGALVCRIIADKYSAAPMPPPLRPDEKIRLGIVTGMFRHHTIWKLMIKGWLSQLDRSRFQVFGYHTGAARDAETDFAVAHCDRFVQGPLPGDRWREEILADRPHILLYPDIGMDPVAAWLAAHRLAPTQCVTWGHPNTTGYPTIDYFLSSALMEPPDGEQHYTERLVRLPNLSIYYEPLDLKPVTAGREQLGLRPSSVAYWCGQSLFKYLPQFDEVFARIAKQVGDCQFAFIASQHGEHVTARMRDRLNLAFAALGLDAAKHCVFLPRLGLEQFVAAVGQCDVVLDSIGWSGGNTTLEGLAHDVPIVTMAGPMMRGRHTMAMLKRMGVTDTIADTVDDYVSIAVRLGRDPAWRTELKQQISQNKHRVYRDSSAIAALEDFLCRVAREEAEPVAERHAAEWGPPAFPAESTIALNPPVQSNSSPQIQNPRSEPQVGDLRFTSHRNTPRREQRSTNSAATEISAIRERKHGELKRVGVFQHEGA
jgi:protein O-GlcNAc transferase